jgi:F-type H+-transporting ATPase subunit delta
MKNTRVARRYAVALMSAAAQQKTVEATAKDLEAIAKVLHDSRELRLLVASPVVPVARKRAIFEEIFAGHISRETLRFLHLLTSKSREGILSELIEQFRVLHDESLGIVNVEVRTVVQLSYAQEKDLRAELERLIGKKPRIHQVLDASIRGGLIVRIGDTVLDASVSHQLELMRARFIAGHAA